MVTRYSVVGSAEKGENWLWVISRVVDNPSMLLWEE
jgi:hypothetical protein